MFVYVRACVCVGGWVCVLRTVAHRADVAGHLSAFWLLFQTASMQGLRTSPDAGDSDPAADVFVVDAPATKASVNQVESDDPCCLCWLPARAFAVILHGALRTNRTRRAPTHTNTH